MKAARTDDGALPERHADHWQRRITVLGSTGSVGCNTLDLVARARIARNGVDPGRIFPLEALTAQRNVAALVDQALKFRPRLAVIGDPALYRDLEDGLFGSGIEVAAGPGALVEAARRPADWVMAAIVGAAGLEPTLEAVRRGAMVALANKECLVCAGPLLMAAVRASGAKLLPVDSVLNGKKPYTPMPRISDVALHSMTDTASNTQSKSNPNKEEL